MRLLILSVADSLSFDDSHAFHGVFFLVLIVIAQWRRPRGARVRTRAPPSTWTIVYRRYASTRFPTIIIFSVSVARRRWQLATGVFENATLDAGHEVYQILQGRTPSPYVRGVHSLKGKVRIVDGYVIEEKLAIRRTPSVTSVSTMDLNDLRCLLLFSIYRSPKNEEDYFLPVRRGSFDGYIVYGRSSQRYRRV